MLTHYHVHQRRQGGYGWLVEWLIEGRRRRKFFKTKKKAQAWAELRNIELHNSGVNALSISEEMRVQMQRALLKLEPYGKTLEEAVEVALPIFEASRKSKDVASAVETLLIYKRSEGCSERYLSDLKSRLGAFSKRFGSRPLSCFGTRELRDYLHSLPCSAVSKNNMRRVLSVLFSFGIESEWCDQNPAQKLRSFGQKRENIGILTVEQAKALLHAAPLRVLPYLAIGLFAGLRRSELLRVTPDAISETTIRVSVTKAGVSRRFVKLRPNLKSWLERYSPTPLSEMEFRDDLEEARRDAGITDWPANAMRHSFCSYALALEQDAGKLALEMGHTTPITLFNNYRELVTEKEAQRYWTLAPA